MRRCLIIAIFASLAAACMPEAPGDGAGLPDLIPADTVNRLERYSAGAALLDTGDNEAAAAFFESALSDAPGRIEFAEGLIEARSRLCASETALAYLERPAPGVPDERKEIFRLYLNGARERLERNFKNASFYFNAAAAAAEKGADPVSAVFCRSALVSSELNAHDARSALEAVRRIRIGDARGSAEDRLLVEKSALEAACLSEADSLNAAERLFRQALSRARARGFTSLETACLRGLGRIEEMSRRDREALTLYEQALVLARTMRSPRETAMLLTRLGLACVRMGADAEAAAHFIEGEKIAGECGLPWILGYLSYGRGVLAEREGHDEKALKLFEESLALHREGADNSGELSAHLELERLRMGLGDYPKAITHLEFALETYEKEEHLNGMSWALGELAAAHLKLGDLEKAEGYYRRSLEVRRRIGDRKGAAGSLLSLGMIAERRGRYRDALSFSHAAMAISDTIGDRGGIGEAHYSIGSVFFHIGDYDEALRHFDEAFAAAAESGSRQLLERAVSGMGSAYSLEGRLDLAEELYQKCLVAARASKEKTQIIWALINLASHFIERRELAGARRCLDEALAILPAEGQNHMRARALYLLGKTDGPRGSSIDYLERSLSLAETSGDEELKWKCLTDLGELYLAEGDTAKAYSMQHHAIVAIESLRRLAGSDELHRHSLEPAILPYERIVSLILARNGRGRDVKEALVYAERRRAQDLSMFLKEAMIRSGSAGNENLRERERELLSKLTFYQSRLQDGALSAKERADLIEKIEGIEKRFLTFSIRLGEEDKTYAEALYPKVEQPDELLEALDPGEVMLAYSLGDKQSHLLVAKGAILKAYGLPARSVIEKKTEHFRGLLQQHIEAGRGGFFGDSVRAAAAPDRAIHLASVELYEMLIGPARKDFDSVEPLVIVPDGFLNSLPFALLQGLDGYLVENHDISYAPSLRTLRFLRERNEIRARLKSVPRYHLIAIGATGESTDGSTDDGSVYPFTGIPIESLPGAVREARDAASLFARSLVLTGRGASEEAFRGSPLDDTGVLHIAAQAYIARDDAKRSFIVLNPRFGFEDTLAGPAEDGLLQWHEAVSLRLNAALVTLSACRSGGGGGPAGDGVSGFAQALLYAGGGCVLAEQLDVPAGNMTGEVYRNIRKGMNAAAALSAAQREAIAGGGAPSELAVWGAFVAIGDGASKPRLSRELSREQYAALALLIAIAVIVALNIRKRRGRF